MGDWEEIELAKSCSSRADDQLGRQSRPPACVRILFCGSRRSRTHRRAGQVEPAATRARRPLDRAGRFPANNSLARAVLDDERFGLVKRDQLGDSMAAPTSKLVNDGLLHGGAESFWAWWDADRGSQDANLILHSRATALPGARRDSRELSPPSNVTTQIFNCLLFFISFFSLRSASAIISFPFQVFLSTFYYVLKFT